jgi:hypothetical protein
MRHGWIGQTFSDRSSRVLVYGFLFKRKGEMLTMEYAGAGIR